MVVKRVDQVWRTGAGKKVFAMVEGKWQSRAMRPIGRS